MIITKNIVHTRVAEVHEVSNRVNWHKTGRKVPGTDRDEYDYDNVSRGWFVRFVNSWESLFVSMERPSFVKGDPATVVYTVYPWPFGDKIERCEVVKIAGAIEMSYQMKNLRTLTVQVGPGYPFDPAKLTEDLKAAGFTFRQETCPVKIIGPWDTVNSDDGQTVTFRQWDL